MSSASPETLTPTNGLTAKFTTQNITPPAIKYFQDVKNTLPTFNILSFAITTNPTAVNKMLRHMIDMIQHKQLVAHTKFISGNRCNLLAAPNIA